MKFRRLVAAVAASVLLTVSLSACALNAGTAAKEKLQGFLDTIGEVTLANLAGTNPLPFTGAVSGVVVISADTSSERANEILNMLGEYRANSSNNVDRLRFEWGYTVLGVTDNRDRNDKNFTEATELLSQPGVHAVVLSSPDNSFTGVDDIVTMTQESGVVLVAEAPSDFIRVFELAVDHSAAAKDPYRKPGAAAQTADGLFYATSTIDFESAANPSLAISIFQAVESQTPVLEAKLTPSSIELRVETAEQRAAAEQLIATLSVPSDFSTIVNNGNLTTSNDAAPDAEALYAATSGIPGIEAVKITGDSVTVTLDGVDRVAEFRQAMGDPLQYSGISFISLNVPSADTSEVTPGWSLTASPAQLDEFLAFSDALWATGEMMAMRLALAQSSITFIDGKEDAMRQVFSATKGLWPSGLKTLIRTTSDEQFGFFEVSGTTLTSSKAGTTQGQQEFIDRVLAAWNAA